MSKQTDLINIPDAITVSGSNVGIGTSSPDVALDVIGTTTSGIRLKSQESSSNGFNIYNNSATDTAVLNNPFNGPMLFETANTERMRIDSSGNVGIGVNSPASWAKLDILGTGGSQTGATQALHVKSPSATAGEGVGIRLSAASGSHEAVGIIGMVNNASGNAGSMTFHTYDGGGTIPERMRIDSSGNVGIGTSSIVDTAWYTSSGANTELALDGNSGYGIIHLRGTGAGSTNTEYTQGVGNGKFYMAYDAVANQHRMTVDSSGLVTMPYQPAFCTTGHTANFNNVTFKGTVLLNNGNCYSTSSGKFTAPVAGIYAFSFNLTTEDTNSHFSYISVNGGNANGYQLAYGVIYQTATQNIVVSLAAGDYVEGKRRATGYSVYKANFSGYLIG